MIRFIAASDMRCSFSGLVDSAANDRDLSKIRSALNHAEDCRFIVDLGDVLLGNEDVNICKKLFSELADCYNDGNINYHMLMGERDRILGKRDFLSYNGYATRYRAFDVSDYRCIFLDTCPQEEGSLFSVDSEQLEWLARLLGRAHRPAVIFSHAPLALEDESDEALLVSNRSEICDLIENSGKVALVLSGHSDVPRKVIRRGVPYITIAPSYTSDEATFAKVSVSSAGVEIEGFGAQPSYSLTSESSAPKTSKPKIKCFLKKRK